MRLIVYDVPTIAQVDDRRQEGTQDPLPLVRPVGLEPTHPNGYLILSQARLPIPPQRPKKGSGNKHEQQPRDNNAPNQRDTRTPAAPSASPTRVRGRSQPANPDRPQLTHQHREHPGANTQAPPAHPAHHQCRHTPQRDSTRSRAVPLCCFRSPVGVAGLEPTTSPSRRGRATKLRHTPKTGKLFHYSVQFSLLVSTVARSRATVKT